MSNVLQSATVLTPTPRRHALGMPAGSVRALLALALLGLLWATALTHPYGETISEADKHLPTILIALQILMVLVLVHFFTAHGHTIGRHISGASPLGMPGGSIRFVLAVGYIALSIFLLYNQADFDLPDKGCAGRCCSNWSWCWSAISPGCWSPALSAGVGATRRRRRTRTWKHGWRFCALGSGPCGLNPPD